jgi:protein-S-isoprenylcysteine O-methyltransferase Ste14
VGDLAGVRRHVTLLGHAVVGWVVCGATIGLGRQLMSMSATLIVHAVVAPVAFGLLTWRYVRRVPEASPLATSMTVLAVVVGLDGLVVAPLIERSYAMFGSVLGTWVPFASIALSSYVVARLAGPRSRSREERGAVGEPSVGGPSGVRTRSIFTRMVLAWVVTPLFFLVTGGSLAWWEAWVYCVLVLVPMTLFVARVARTDPEFLERRLAAKEKERTQRRLVLWSVPLLLALFLMPGLDRRFGWSEPSLATVIAAQAVSLASYLELIAVFVANRWAARTVETWPGQQVVSTGPYAIVRHPMYLAILVLFLATPVALGSWWATIPAVLYVPMLVARILNEEEVLLRELPGYEEYRKRVRYRLLPHVW